MTDPILDTHKLGAVIDWTQDLVDELELRKDLLPCKNIERLGDCISRQGRFIVQDMKPKKMCVRCQARWHIMMALELMRAIHAAKTAVIEEAPSW